MKRKKGESQGLGLLDYSDSIPYITQHVLLSCDYNQDNILYLCNLTIFCQYTSAADSLNAELQISSLHLTISTLPKYLV